MATHSSILAWRIPWSEEPGGLQSMWLQRVGHNLVTNFFFFFFKKKRFGSFHHYDVSCGFVVYGFYYVEVHSLYSHC